MPELVYIGNGAKTHLRADGTGIIPEGRARCDVTNDGKAWIYRKKRGGHSSPRARHHQDGQRVTGAVTARSLAEHGIGPRDVFEPSTRARSRIVRSAPRPRSASVGSG